ncbi:MAG: hypothetical protein IPO08_22605 [Xanthomonadales bacterium]|nr:hypothetical protein [Xanthomonadales bacterium]
MNSLQFDLEPGTPIVMLPKDSSLRTATARTIERAVTTVSGFGLRRDTYGARALCVPWLPDFCVVDVQPPLDLMQIDVAATVALWSVLQNSELQRGVINVSFATPGTP